MFHVVLGSTLPSGLYTLYEQQWGLSRAQTTVIFSIYVAGVLLSLVGLGGVADRYGRKASILISTVLGVASNAIFLCAWTPPALYVARFLSGLSVGLCTGAFTAALNDRFGRRAGTTSSAVVTSAALAAGPVASAVVASALPHPLRLPSPCTWWCC
ncbi:multidrug efflux system protein MdtL [Corynebacterium ciconiae DSM 44920]|uniref:MFS transporter n=1 Tax=Corynebacterium ciconiae TaxID=227319 RepID=UPI0003682D83|nr:MFS transporter [Corynebacterium ciconiae]WKD60512.1 multidrug efflux system protein MdtL [Corynebacterium ciconiae DSM 44920]